jgi:endonuclease YncB( thermonuclease family)
MIENRVALRSSLLRRVAENAGGRRSLRKTPAWRYATLAILAGSLCFVTESQAGKPPRRGGGPARQQQGRPAVPSPEEEPQWELPQRAPKPPRPERRPNRETTPEPPRPLPDDHPDREPGTSREVPPSVTPLLESRSISPPALLEHHTFVRRHQRHVERWVVTGVYPGVPYSLGWQVEEVMNGNTIRARNPANVSQIVRLFGVAAPHEGQVFFSDSRDHLKSQILGQTVYVQRIGNDETETLVAKVFNGSVYVNKSQISDGMAFYDADQGIDLDLANAQIEAQDAGRGIWGDPALVSELADSE